MPHACPLPHRPGPAPCPRSRPATPQAVSEDESRSERERGNYRCESDTAARHLQQLRQDCYDAVGLGNPVRTREYAQPEDAAKMIFESLEQIIRKILPQGNCEPSASMLKDHTAFAISRRHVYVNSSRDMERCE